MRYDQRGRGIETFGPLLLSAGYQLRPRWSVEAGASYWRDQSNSSATLFTTDGKQVDYRYDSRRWRASVPLRARYTLTRHSTRRLQIDAVGGVVVAVSRDHFRNTQVIDGQPSGEYAGLAKGLGLAANLGVGARLGLGASRRTEVAADVLLNKNIQPTGRTHALYNNVYGLLETLTLGLRYRI
ncbi:hypothetical protein [Hymenobacter sp. CRA2]|uniref:hypothetical protein n=1 Tax=Hymenobacter sp. CRA2 TaxID=1955620 RepID=UPI0011172D9F|nr:hypothetical protein [Hymenobacter sp. CRA2]